MNKIGEEVRVRGTGIILEICNNRYTISFFPVGFCFIIFTFICFLNVGIIIKEKKKKQ
jgi:hypothetical protein